MSLEIDTSRRGTLCLSEIINVVLYFCLFFFIPSVFAYFNPLIITCSKAKVIWRASRTQEITSFPVAPQSFWTTATKSIAKWLSCPTTFECPAGPQVLDQVSLKDLIFEIKYVSLFFLLFSSYWYLLCKSGVVKCFLAHSLYTSGSENDCCALPSAQSLFVSQSKPAILLYHGILSKKLAVSRDVYWFGNDSGCFFVSSLFCCCCAVLSTKESRMARRASARNRINEKRDPERIVVIIIDVTSYIKFPCICFAVLSRMPSDFPCRATGGPLFN